MRIAVAAIAFTLVFFVLTGAAVVYSGIYNVAASDAHWPMVRWFFERAKTRSIRAHADGIAAPVSLDDTAMLRAGVEHFAAHCAVCHGAPGVPKGDIARGMYPPPPTLAEAALRYSPEELFWIVKNGIKMTGMPSWRDHGDDELWATVAFLRQLPTMTEQEYVRHLQANMMGTGDHHGAAPAGTGQHEHEHKH